MRPPRPAGARGAIRLLAACALTVPACSGPRAADPPEPAPDLFRRSEVVLGTAPRQTVLPVRLLGGPIADLAVAHVAANGSRGLRVFAWADGVWTLRFETALDAGVRFADVVRIDGRDRLLLGRPGRLTWLDPEARAERPLVEADVRFHPPRADEIPHLDLSHDLNGDGLDDLAVPAADGFHVRVQRPDGAFADPVTIGPVPDLRGILGADAPRFDPWSRSRVHRADLDGDGRDDLISWEAGALLVHRQGEDGRFADSAIRVPLAVPLDSGDPLSLAEGSMTGRALHSLADINGDGVPDLVVASLQGERVADKRSAFEVHLGGRADGGGTIFGTEPDLVLRSPGAIVLDLRLHDLDGDGLPDLMLTAIDRGHLRGGLWKRIRGFMGDDVRLRLEFHRNRGGRFSGMPDAVRRIALDGPPSMREPGWVPLDVVLRGATHERRRTQPIWPRAWNATLRLGDANGDGRADLLIGQHPRSLEVHLGAAGPAPFAPAPVPVAVAMPNDEEYVRLADLDRDGRMELLLHHPFTRRDGHGAPLRPRGQAVQRLVVLWSR